MPGTAQNLKGQVFGRLTVIEDSGRAKNGSVLWKCKCQCGKEHFVTTGNLNSGSTVSCGCFKSDYVSQKNTIHGESYTRLHSIWRGMLDRCENENDEGYHNYGERGIKIAPEWHEYVAFRDWSQANGYADNLSIERINVDGNYEPANCMWATDIQQANNKRNCRVLEFKGVRQTAAEWARQTGVPRGTIVWRVDHGWDIGDALFKLTYAMGADT